MDELLGFIWLNGYEFRKFRIVSLETIIYHLHSQDVTSVSPLGRHNITNGIDDELLIWLDSNMPNMGAGTGGAGWASAHPGKKSGWAWPTLEILAVVYFCDAWQCTDVTVFM